MLLVALLAPVGWAEGGAPRGGDRFVNLAGVRPRPSRYATWSFLARKVWTTIVGRAGGAHLVPYDAAAIRANPSVTWIGHATFLVRMDGVTFLTDPMFSQRASPVSFAGPPRLVPPGVPLDALPKIDFVTLSHDHYDHTDMASIARPARCAFHRRARHGGSRARGGRRDRRARLVAEHASRTRARALRAGAAFLGTRPLG